MKIILQDHDVDIKICEIENTCIVKIINILNCKIGFGEIDTDEYMRQMDILSAGLARTSLDAIRLVLKRYIKNDDILEANMSRINWKGKFFHEYANIMYCDISNTCAEFKRLLVQ